MINYLMYPPKHKKSTETHEASSLFTWNHLPCEVQYCHYHMHEVMSQKGVPCPHEHATDKTLKKINEKNRARQAGY